MLGFYKGKTSASSDFVMIGMIFRKLK